VATAYALPEEAPPAPDFGDFFGPGQPGHDAYFAALTAWEAEVAALAVAWYPEGGDLQGYVYRYPVADGKASYLVARTKPLELWWLDEGDGYSLPEPHLRGLRVADLRQAQKRDAKLAELFGRGAKAGA
jgi:hypothetical protein